MTSLARQRPSAGAWLTALGAILVVVALPLAWFHLDRAVHPELTGWGVFLRLRVWLAVAAVLALLSALLPQGRGVLVVRTLLGLAVGVPVLRHVVSPPQAAVAVHDRAGLWVALAGAILVIGGGLLDAGRRAAVRVGIPFATAPERRLPPPTVVDGHAEEL